MPVHPDYPDPRLIPDDVRFNHVCEVCGKSRCGGRWSWTTPPPMT